MNPVDDFIGVAPQSTQARDAYLDVALDGVQLIEASAGTGKTFTLATLVTRLVVERDLTLGQILAVTFTDAATQELRARLRKRLALAADMARVLVEEATLSSRASTRASTHPSPEAVLTRQILERQLQYEDGARLLARLQRAEHEIDLASVFTIHGFCARALSEHALQTGQPFDAREMIGSERELHDEIAADLWRAYGADTSDASALQVLWSGPELLASDLDALLRCPQLLPGRPPQSVDPMPQLQAAALAVRQSFPTQGVELRASLEAAIAGKVLNGNSYKADLPETLWRGLESWCSAGDAAADLDPRLERLTPATLALRTNKDKHHLTPSSPLCEAIAVLIEARDLRTQWLGEQALILLHRLREDARQRLMALKRMRRLQTYDDLIDGVADALEGTQGEALARSLRSQYAAALVDEFQDTDPRQWSIFKRLFATGSSASDQDAAPTPLFLIGDPKQAIYGFRGGDVFTYLEARRDALIAPPLAHNFRSRPGVLRAIEALYAQAGDTAFVDQDIQFHPVQAGAGSDDADYLRNGEAAPALSVRVLASDRVDRNGTTVALAAPQSRRVACEACVQEIHAVLSDARAGRASIKGVAVQPGDIAVLVRNHAEATRMQAALCAVGIPAVAAGKQSLFETEQALELLAVFEALLQPADESRLRAALATVLLGVDAAGIARLDHDDAWRSDRQLEALRWRERWQRHGPLALVTDLCAANAERLLQLVDGERRLTNGLQLAEQLQAAAAHALGMHGLVEWLRTQIADADSNDETQLLRLESDARRVQILTLHKSKGQEFPLVFLPFVGIGRKDEKPTRHCTLSAAGGRVLHWKSSSADDAPRWTQASEDWALEQRAEDARLLYVGLTRTEHALWLAGGELYQHHATALAPMLEPLQGLQVHADIVVDSRPPQGLPSPLPTLDAPTVPPARIARRMLPRDWWMYSFTQLSKADAGDVADSAAAALSGERGAEDEPDVSAIDAVEAGSAESVVATFDRRFGGSRFGNVLHEAMEHVDFAAWRGWHQGDDVPIGQDDPLRDALRGGGYAEADLDDGQAQLATLVGNTLTVDLPEGGRLCELPGVQRRAELEFHFSLQPTSVESLLATLHAHGVLRDRRAFGLHRQLEGLMTGKIDLTYLRQGRWYLLDYKSNRLSAYDAQSLVQAMAHSEYDLQALIYTVALHRWLRFRLGDAYDYVRDFGGTRYLFCRGIGIEGDGVHAWTPPVELVHALDGLFAGAAA